MEGTGESNALILRTPGSEYEVPIVGFPNAALVIRTPDYETGTRIVSTMLEIEKLGNADYGNNLATISKKRRENWPRIVSGIRGVTDPGGVEIAWDVDGNVLSKRTFATLSPIALQIDETISDQMRLAPSQVKN